MLLKCCQVACYIGIILDVSLEPKLSHTAALILQAIHAGQGYGFSVMEMTGLPSGTVYPAMRRLERDGLIRSQWEAQSIAERKGALIEELARLEDVSVEIAEERQSALEAQALAEAAAEQQAAQEAAAAEQAAEQAEQ